MATLNGFHGIAVERLGVAKVKQLGQRLTSREQVIVPLAVRRYHSRMRGDEHEKAKRHVPPDAVPVSKLEAAFRQLRAAILLYFSNGDAVAIHTLAYASHEILRQLAKAKGIKAGLDGESIQMLGKGMTAGEARSFLGLSAGFFKHAGRDAGAVHMFQPEVNEHFLNEAVCLHVELTGEYHEELECLRFAVMVRNPHLVNKNAMSPEEYAIWVRRAEDIKQKKITPRDMLPLVRKLARQFVAAKKRLGSSSQVD